MQTRIHWHAICAIVALATFPGCQSTAITPPWRSQSSLPDEVARFQDPGPSRTDPKAFAGREPLATGPVERSSTSSQGPSSAQIVKQVIVTGNRLIPEHQILRHIRTRPGRYFDPDLLQEDVNQIWQMKGIRRVNGPFLDKQPDGIVVTFEVSERPYMESVKYVGNRAITDRQLAKETGLKDGDPLDMHAVRMAKTRIEDYYEEKGFPKTEVSIVSGDKIEDREVVFLINEDELQRVSTVTFEGNTIASDGRLRSFIKMKPGIAWYFGGKVNRRELEQDEQRLTAYYRALGFFNARIGRELEESEDGRWLGIHYIINEGPRYRVRSVSFVGNEKYSSDELATVVKLTPDGGEPPEFNAAKMNEDVTRLQDLYGSQGYVFANVEASPDFLEEPGLLDLVYRIDEGKQYRVGNINVVIDGEYGITKRQVVLNRLGNIRPGDPIDARLLREAEIRLARSQLFVDGVSTPGPAPRVVVKTPDLDELARGKRR
jgi:outer membrane protein insertion porin family